MRKWISLQGRCSQSQRQNVNESKQRLVSCREIVMTEDLGPWANQVCSKTAFVGACRSEGTTSEYGDARQIASS